MLVACGRRLRFRAYSARRAGAQGDEFKMKSRSPADHPQATLARSRAASRARDRSGVPAVQALTIVANTVDNVHVARKIERCAREWSAASRAEDGGGNEHLHAHRAAEVAGAKRTGALAT